MPRLRRKKKAKTTPVTVRVTEAQLGFLDGLVTDDFAPTRPEAFRHLLELERRRLEDVEILKLRQKGKG